MPVIEYVSFSWYTPAINTLVNNTDKGSTDKVKETVVPSPTKSSLAIELEEDAAIVTLLLPSSVRVTPAPATSLTVSTVPLEGVRFKSTSVPDCILE